MNKLLDSEILMTINDASIFLNFKVSRLRSLIFKKEIPFFKIGGSVRFKKADLQKWVDSHKVNK